jgi:ATP-dependent DNA helicase RecG
MNLDIVLKSGESTTIEFKESYSSSIAREICAFANAYGGKILLGVSDEGELKGITISNNRISRIYDIARNFDPPLKIEVARMGNILIIDVPEGTDKPYTINGKFYVRHGTNTQQLKRDEIRRFFQEEGLILFDEKLNYDFDMEEDFDEASFRAFLGMTRTSPILDKYDILKNLELLKNGYLTNAGVLLFCKKVTKFVRNATITCVLFQGRDKYKILDRKEFDGDLHSNYQDTVTYLQSKLNTEYIIKGGPREEKLELPESALREAILNAIAHRNYFANTNIQVYIFSDRVEIVNPGGLPPGMSYADLGKKSMPRNFSLFGLMQRMALVEKVGTGILRMNQAMDEYKLEKPIIEADENWFSIIFKRPELEKESFESRGNSTPLKTPLKPPLKTPLKILTGLEKKVLNAINNDTSISRTGIARTLNISPDTVKEYLERLKRKGVIKRIGPAKGGYWEVIEDEK